MNSLEAPKLNPWPFIAADGALLGTAAFIAFQSPVPLDGVPLLAVTGCVALGAISAMIPFLVNFSRRQEAFLLERQNEIAALAQSTATSAEQLSIAASSLHTIADSSARALKHADLLPQKLQEKINEFKSQLNEVAVTDNEAMAQEINTLRAGETERLESAVTAIRKIASELAALDAANRKHINEFKGAIDTLTESVRKASQDGAAAIAAAQHNAISSIEASLQNAAVQFAQRAGAGEAPRSTPQDFSTGDNPVTPSPEKPRTVSHTAAPRRVEHAPSESGRNPSTEAAVADLPDSVSSENMDADEGGGTATALAVAAKPPAKKRAARKSALDGPELSLAFESISAIHPSVDGATRLLVTAYIGIGNKLYVRGEGPGLSWDKGVALQFVSIGKWRWETTDAASAVTIKLYKNDEQECTLGAVTFEAGQQCEVSAHF